MKLNKVITKFPGVVSLSTAKVSELNLLYYLLINSFSLFLSFFALAFQFPFDLIFFQHQTIEVLGNFPFIHYIKHSGFLKQIVCIKKNKNKYMISIFFAVLAFSAVIFFEQFIEEINAIIYTWCHQTVNHVLMVCIYKRSLLIQYYQQRYIRANI